MPSKCTKCGNTENYNFALNIGLCNPCIGERLEELETELEQHRWISVSERLPEKDINYTILVWSDNGEQCFVHEADCINDKFFSMTGHEIHWITHWKPIILP